MLILAVSPPTSSVFPHSRPKGAWHRWHEAVPESVERSAHRQDGRAFPFPLMNRPPPEHRLFFPSPRPSLTCSQRLSVKKGLYWAFFPPRITHRPLSASLISTVFAGQVPQSALPFHLRKFVLCFFPSFFKACGTLPLSLGQSGDEYLSFFCECFEHADRHEVLRRRSLPALSSLSPRFTIRFDVFPDLLIPSQSPVSFQKVSGRQ